MKSLLETVERMMTLAEGPCSASALNEITTLAKSIRGAVFGWQQEVDLVVSRAGEAAREPNDEWAMIRLQDAVKAIHIQAGCSQE